MAVVRNVEYDVLGQAGKGVRPGAVRVATPESVYGVQTVAYVNPDGTHALTAYNSWQSDQTLVVDAGTRHVERRCRQGRWSRSPGDETCPKLARLESRG